MSDLLNGIESPLRYLEQLLDICTIKPIFPNGAVGCDCQLIVILCFPESFANVSYELIRLEHFVFDTEGRIVHHALTQKFIFLTIEIV
jgi:hypothetical protein